MLRSAPMAVPSSPVSNAGLRNVNNNRARSSGRSADAVPRIPAAAQRGHRGLTSMFADASPSQGRLVRFANRNYAEFHHRGDRLKPKAGDCCVFCSWGTVSHRQYRVPPDCEVERLARNGGAVVVAPKGDQAIGAPAWAAASRHQIRTGR
jgi:hypothetical protein